MTPALQKSFQQDIQYLKTTQLPIVTVTGAFREDVKRWHHLPNDNTTHDIIFSRAHFSMAYGLLRSVWENETPQPKKAWLVDPTNYVSDDQWKKITITEKIGETIARYPILKTIKDLIDRFGRNKLPILESITPPLVELFTNVEKPILSFHIAAGNILLDHGHTVVQVITDPHVRADYLIHADNPQLTWCVFDKNTQQAVISQAKQQNIAVSLDRVIVTGPPIDERIVLSGQQKQPYLGSQRPLRVVLTTGGLGTNKGEIKSILSQLLPIISQSPSPFEVMVYCGTEQDIFEMVKNQAEQTGIKPHIIGQNNGSRSTLHTPLSILHHPQLFDANELLIRHAFPWADVFITKPSGDMAYDAVTSGSALLTLKPWGIWEEHIQKIFEKLDTSQPADVDQITSQFIQMIKSSWITQAMKNAQEIDELYLNGNVKILKAYKKTTQ